MFIYQLVLSVSILVASADAQINHTKYGTNNRTAKTLCENIFIIYTVDTISALERNVAPFRFLLTKNTGVQLIDKTLLKRNASDANLLPGTASDALVPIRTFNIVHTIGKT